MLDLNSSAVVPPGSNTKTTKRHPDFSLVLKIVSYRIDLVLVLIENLEEP